MRLQQLKGEPNHNILQSHKKVYQVQTKCDNQRTYPVTD